MPRLAPAEVVTPGAGPRPTSSDRSRTGWRGGPRPGPTPRRCRRAARATSRRRRARCGSACAGWSRPCPSPRKPGSKSHTSAVAVGDHQPPPGRLRRHPVEMEGKRGAACVARPRWGWCGACPTSAGAGRGPRSPSSPIQRTPHAPSASTTSASSLPHGVSEYAVRPSISARSIDAGAGQRLQPLRQQRGRHLRHAAAQVVEVRAAHQQFADDEHASTARRVAPSPWPPDRTGRIRTFVAPPSSRRNPSVQIWNQCRYRSATRYRVADVGRSARGISQASTERRNRTMTASTTDRRSGGGRQTPRHVGHGRLRRNSPANWSPRWVPCWSKPAASVPATGCWTWPQAPETPPSPPRRPEPASSPATCAPSCSSRGRHCRANEASNWSGGRPTPTRCRSATTSSTS